VLAPTLHSVAVCLRLIVLIVPLGYKFSWSPRGVLNAALNGARFKLDGKLGPTEA